LAIARRLITAATPPAVPAIIARKKPRRCWSITPLAATCLGLALHSLSHHGLSAPSESAKYLRAWSYGTQDLRAPLHLRVFRLTSRSDARYWIVSCRTGGADRSARQRWDVYCNRHAAVDRQPEAATAPTEMPRVAVLHSMARLDLGSISHQKARLNMGPRPTKTEFVSSLARARRRITRSVHVAFPIQMTFERSSP
jgi:hypothetical protein